MRIKTFSAKTMTEVMQAVKASMGDEAVIISTHSDKNGITVMAGLDDNDTDLATITREAVLDVAKDEPVTTSDKLDVIEAALDDHGCPRALARKIVRLAEAADKPDAESALALALDSHFAFLPISDTVQRKPMLLVGAPGVGKTVTTAKLAARAMLAKQKIAIVTTDTLKTGGVEQLTLLTKAMRLTLATAHDAESLKSAIEDCDAEAHIFVDTTGINPFDREELQFIKSLSKAYDMDVTLLLAAGTDVMEAAEIATIFAENLPIKRVLLTRLDLARRLGGLLAAADAARLPLSEVGVVPNIMDGLKTITPLALARLILTDTRKPKINVFHVD